MLSASQTTTVFRRVAIILVAVLGLLPISVRAQDATAAQDFVQTNIQSALSILRDESLAPKQQRDRINALLLSLLDGQRIALFTLGRARATANPADLAAFTDTFREFMIENYDAGLRVYTNKALNVTGLMQRAPGDYVVTGVIVDQSGSANGKAPENVDFRVLYEHGRYFIVDASVEGVWLAMVQRDDFQNFLNEHKGDIAALTGHLKEITARIRQSTAAK